MNYFMYTSHHYQYLIFQLTSVLNSKPVADSNCFSFPFRVRVIGFLLYLLTNLHKQADFWQVNIFHLFLSRYSSKSHNFITLIFVRSSLSSLLLFRVDGQKQSKAAMFGRSVFFWFENGGEKSPFSNKNGYLCCLRSPEIPPLTLPRERYHPGVASRNLLPPFWESSRAAWDVYLSTLKWNKLPKRHKMKCPFCKDGLLEQEQELSLKCSNCGVIFRRCDTALPPASRDKQEADLDSHVVNDKAGSSAGK